MLKKDKNDYNLSRLEKKLGDIGYKLYFVQETRSTMIDIEKYVHEIDYPPIVLANHQTQGQGRVGREWTDKAGCSLMFTVLFQIPQEYTAVFADLAALIICEVIRKKAGCDLRLKYPNDLVVDDKKLGGILVKNVYDKNLNYLATMVGIGINVYYTERELKKIKSDYQATSIAATCAYDIKREDLLIEIMKSLRFLATETVVHEANEKSRLIFEKKWKELSNMLGRKIAILKDTQIIGQGIAVNTEIGRGIELKTSHGRKWYSMFETNYKARILS